MSADVFHTGVVPVEATYDETCDAVYIYLRKHVEGERWRAYKDDALFDRHGMTFDVDEAGKIVGFEIIGATRHLPEGFVEAIKNGSATDTKKESGE